MTLEQAFFILRHGSAEGNHKYLEAVKVIEDEYNRQKETIEQLQTALFKCGEDAVEIENYKKISEYQQSLSMDRGFEIKRLKEEIERLKAPRYVAIPKPSNKYKSEISPLVYTEEFTLKRIDEEGIRAEAVKEFAEMVKEKIRTMSRIVVYDEDIDNLVKEFTEGEQK